MTLQEIKIELRKINLDDNAIAIRQYNQILFNLVLILQTELDKKVDKDFDYVSTKTDFVPQKMIDDAVTDYKARLKAAIDEAYPSTNSDNVIYIKKLIDQTD